MGSDSKKGLTVSYPAKQLVKISTQSTTLAEARSSLSKAVEAALGIASETTFFMSKVDRTSWSVLLL